MAEERSAFGERLNELIKSCRMTQKELAKKANVTEAAMSHYIKGDRTPRSAVLARIAIALGTTSEYLLEGVPQSSDEEIKYAKKLIARNAYRMTNEQKKEIISTLFSNEEN